MRISEKDYNRMPAHLKALFTKLPNPQKDEVLAAFPQSSSGSGRRPLGATAATFSGVSCGPKPNGEEFIAYADAGAGSAARFFYCAKASKRDRDEGLTTPEQPIVTFATANGTSGKASSISEGRETSYRNNHPTVKPTDLMRYLCRLVTPPSGTVVDPFMGSGSTGKAAVLEGFSFVGIEQDAAYFDIACRRVEAAYKAAGEPVEREARGAIGTKQTEDQFDLFAEVS